MKERYVRICPMCKSKHVTERGAIGKAYINSNVCLSCGFQSSLFPEVTRDEAKEIPDRPKRFVVSRLPILCDNSIFHRKDMSDITVISFLIMIILLVMLLLWG